MATIIADNIISPLGFTTDDNYQAIVSGQTALRHYNSANGVPFPFTAALFSDAQTTALQMEGYSLFESVAIRSINAALQQIAFTPDSHTALIISSTKANVGLLTETTTSEHVISPGVAAQAIADAVGITTTPIVVNNACISGVSALITAHRLLTLGIYKHCIMCGIDLQTPFILAGFQSLKALSETPCRPFDIERLGLNLGEAAATIVLSNDTKSDTIAWQINSGCVRNDAFHISSPSPHGEGCTSAIRQTLRDIDKRQLAVINAHGTATMYNDQMEAKAISNADVANITVNALKGYIGHTMGAAGILETILTAKALDHHTIIGTKGFDEMGVSGRLHIATTNETTEKQSFLKIISGFGGCNAALCLSKSITTHTLVKKHQPTIIHRIKITTHSVEIDGQQLTTTDSGKTMLTALYKTHVGNYPRYYKMDGLARLGFLASELLLKDMSNDTHCAVVFFNKYASLNADRAFLHTISDANNFFPSPSEFVYTLANIVNGEIAIRHHLQEETCFYVLPEHDEQTMDNIATATLADTETDHLLYGWLEYTDDNNFYAELKIATK
ncbi:MAG: beta-ketoacyl synthase N-terminal-like domain-containing protein [Bacteroidales bacterium]|nr:beta-ketoacyl synthase N-terminal-like domain-containing protein [Bacteroidales bacterium]